MAITKLESSRDFFRIWFFWQRQATFVFLLIVGLVMLYAYTATPKYESVANVLLLPRTNQDLVITAGADSRQVIQKISPEDLNTEMNLLLSDKVIHDTINMFPNTELGLKAEKQGFFNTTKDAIKGMVNVILQLLRLKGGSVAPLEAKAAQLKGALSVSIFESNILDVTLKTEQAEQGAIVLTKLLDNYIRHHNQVFSIDKGLNFYDDQSELYSSNLYHAETALKQFQHDNQIIDLDGQNAANILLFTEIRKELQYLEIAYDESYTKNKIFTTALEKDDDVLITKEMRNIPAIIELEKGITPLLIKRSELSKTFTKNSREYRSIDDQISMINGELKNVLRKALKADALELESMLSKKESLHVRLDNIYQEAGDLKEKERTLDGLKRQVEFAKSKYEVYSSKTEDSRIYDEKKKRNISNVIISGKPSVSPRPVSPNRLLLLALSVFFASIAAVALPFILETLDQKLKTADDVEHILGIPVISSFSDMLT